MQPTSAKGARRSHQSWPFCVVLSVCLLGGTGRVWATGPVPLPAPAAASFRQEALRITKGVADGNVRNALCRNYVDLAVAHRSFDEARQVLADLRSDVHVSYDPGYFDLKKAEAAARDGKLDEAFQIMARIAPSLDPNLSLAGMRSLYSLALQGRRFDLAAWATVRAQPDIHQVLELAEQMNKAQQRDAALKLLTWEKQYALANRQVWPGVDDLDQLASFYHRMGEFKLAQETLALASKLAALFYEQRFALSLRYFEFGMSDTGANEFTRALPGLKKAISARRSCKHGCDIPIAEFYDHVLDLAGSYLAFGALDQASMLINAIPVAWVTGQHVQGMFMLSAALHLGEKTDQAQLVYDKAVNLLERHADERDAIIFSAMVRAADLSERGKGTREARTQSRGVAMALAKLFKTTTDHSRALAEIARRTPGAPDSPQLLAQASSLAQQMQRRAPKETDYTLDNLLEQIAQASWEYRQPQQAIAVAREIRGAETRVAVLSALAKKAAQAGLFAESARLAIAAIEAVEEEKDERTRSRELKQILETLPHVLTNESMGPILERMLATVKKVRRKLPDNMLITLLDLASRQPSLPLLDRFSDVVPQAEYGLSYDRINALAALARLLAEAGRTDQAWNTLSAMLAKENPREVVRDSLARALDAYVRKVTARQAKAKVDGLADPAIKALFNYVLYINAASEL
jgi:hypothetical protein